MMILGFVARVVVVVYEYKWNGMQKRKMTLETEGESRTAESGFILNSNVFAQDKQYLV